MHSAASPISLSAPPGIPDGFPRPGMLPRPGLLHAQVETSLWQELAGVPGSDRTPDDPVVDTESRFLGTDVEAGT